VPVEGDFVTLDIDGGILPSDWYLQLAGEAGKMLCGQIPLSENTPTVPATRAGCNSVQAF
jgi:hypothetical protein